MADLATSRHPLSALQRREVLSTQKEFEARCRALDAEVLAAQDSDKHCALLVERRQLELRILVCKSLLSPLRSLPVELLVYIFQLCVDSLPKEPWIKPEQTAAPLCKVSKLWYEAARSTSSLWTTAWIDAKAHEPPDDPMIGGIPAHAHIFRLDLVGSRPWSLSIDARGVGSVDDPTPPDSKPLTYLFRHPAFEFLRKLRIDSDDANQSLFAHKFPLVESLVMYWPSSDDAQDFRQTPSLPQLPSLSKLVLSAFPQVFFQLPTSKLTHLYIGGRGVSGKLWTQIMAACKALEKGTFSIHCFTPNLASDVPLPVEVHQPLLSHLTLFVVSSFKPQVKLTWPSLTHLNLYVKPESRWPMDPNPSSPFVAALSHLTHLTLASSHKEEVDFTTHIAPILTAACHLESLVLHVNVGATHLISFLTPMRRNLPKVQALNLWLSLYSLDRLPDDVEAPIVEYLESIIYLRAMSTISVGGDLEPFGLLRHVYLKLDHSKSAREMDRGLEEMMKTIANGVPGSFLGLEGGVGRLVLTSLNEDVNWEHWDEGFTDFSSRIDLSPTFVRDSL
ncbi:hypothetical protein BKA70DRAFT_1309067 [Coprinopsis sp. MPI-PUGE-AT-0042]|nr:hypothetical protein BKA70DRAFT_1309067 [Coprinopsis sp. MPI-PUGE-AT-0042]